MSLRVGNIVPVTRSSALTTRCKSSLSSAVQQRNQEAVRRLSVNQQALGEVGIMQLPEEVQFCCACPTYWEMFVDQVKSATMWTPPSLPPLHQCRGWNAQFSWISLSPSSPWSWLCSGPGRCSHHHRRCQTSSGNGLCGGWSGWRIIVLNQSCNGSVISKIDIGVTGGKVVCKEGVEEGPEDTPVIPVLVSHPNGMGSVAEKSSIQVYSEQPRPGLFNFWTGLWGRTVLKAEVVHNQHPHIGVNVIQVCEGPMESCYDGIFCQPCTQTGSRTTGMFAYTRKYIYFFLCFNSCIL